MSRAILGRDGENAAAEFFAHLGYTVVMRNYRAGRCEIDIICRDGGFIVFAEVKARSSRDFGTAAAAVTPEKQRRIIKAAEVFLAESEAYAELQPRFDIAEVYSENGRLYVNHIADAFVKKRTGF